MCYFICRDERCLRCWRLIEDKHKPRRVNARYQASPDGEDVPCDGTCPPNANPAVTGYLYTVIHLPEIRSSKLCSACGDPTRWRWASQQLTDRVKAKQEKDRAGVGDAHAAPEHAKVAVSDAMAAAIAEPARRHREQNKCVCGSTDLEDADRGRRAMVIRACCAASTRQSLPTQRTTASSLAHGMSRAPKASGRGNGKHSLYEDWRPGRPQGK